eukprot:CAMPEP_0113534128 /NCGR_PEP_ID=MMETSP0015_2-20120614/4991_1 /TAXON_ID=2838 /ORGANISM="Odontella" /LENGTH=1331 /DNA_ID=CAMNT_0000433263 /DNA_START=92 /DNA_END=4088 /DNA_ORIENTATION=- /assembly_acc=CAM_ASM_000160
MSEARKRGRRAASRGKLRRDTSLEGVNVEKPFTFSRPTEEGGAPASLPEAVQSGGSRSEGNGAAGEAAGDGCYISATVNSKRYYGVMFDQGSLKAASELYFRGEASSLELNRRMMLLEKKRSEQEPASINGSDTKRQKLSHATTSSGPNTDNDRQVQKFRYVNPIEAKEASGPGYRLLLATYANVAVAAEEDPELVAQIRSACASGGNFIGKYYYQYESVGNTLAAKDDSKPGAAIRGMRMSMGLETFLSNTYLPPWYPLCNLECGQSKILSMLNMKKNTKGGVEWDPNSTPQTAAGGRNMTGIIPMEPRSSFRVGIVGAGIAGLSCALELLKLSQSGENKVNMDIVLFEARPRVGGRLNTDRGTFQSSDGKAFPVDLGASWIHGISGNPLTSICKDAGIDIIASSEEVKMLGSSMREVDRRIDKRMGQVFDDMLDKAAADCWNKEDYAGNSRDQKAVRWYASNLEKAGSVEDPQAIDVPPHRYSTDISIDRAIGEAMRKKNRFGRLSDEECNLLNWYAKNTEYALGSNLRDLSMKYWDIDERHAFDGDHVLLKTGYSAVADYMLKRCNEYGKRFRLVTSSPVDKIEYARNTTSHPYPKSSTMEKAAVNLSDTCRITTRDNSPYNFDFVVCALPLGVLKHSISVKKEATPPTKAVTFDPPLPVSKRDAIEHVGFGLLNKVYLQFPTAFWRGQGSFQGDPFLASGQNIFGNASGFNPHHYMFLDVGRSLYPSDNTVDGPPAVLMTLISGFESVESERLSDENLVHDVLATLKHLFSASIVPAPIAIKRTKWGSDEFSRGSYTFLPPGTNDEDYHLLQCAINGNGESIVCSNREIMRLFWAGEHTTSLHPSMAHGAFLSGIRAAQEVFSSITSSGNQSDGSDRPIPISMFRRKHPNAPLQCSMCQCPGSKKGEGALMAFQRGTRQVLVHSHCAEYSPEVGITRQGVWTDVIKAVNRGKHINCALCGKIGATVGCQSGGGCLRTFHFACCQETGWNFERDGKAFFCDLHRSPVSSHYERISPRFYQMKHPGQLVSCALCGNTDGDSKRGEFLGFHWRQRYMLVHKFCIHFTNVVDIIDEEEEDGVNITEYKNIFSAANRAKTCFWCQKNGATIQCSACSRHFHYCCAEDTGWRFKQHERKFSCSLHRNNDSIHTSERQQLGSDSPGWLAGIKSTQPHNISRARHDLPSNAADTSHDSFREEEWDSSESEETDEITIDESAMMSPFDQDPHKSNMLIARLYRVHMSSNISRPLPSDAWNLPLCVDREATKGTTTLRVALVKGKACHPSFEAGDILLSLNGSKIGSRNLKTFAKVLMLLRDSTGLNVEYLRRSKPG